MVTGRSSASHRLRNTNANGGGPTNLDIDGFVEDVDDNDEDGDSFNPNSIGLESIFSGGNNGSVPETSNVMARSGRTVASVPRGRNGVASVPRQGMQQGGLPRVRSAVASVPRGGISPLSRTGLHSASSPSLQLPVQSFAPLPSSKRRSPVVAHVVTLLSTENGDETRSFALSFLCNLLTHAQALEGYEPVLRAVCTPDVMSASDLLSGIHVKAKRYVTETVSATTTSQLPRSASVFSLDYSDNGNRKTTTQLLSLYASASLSVHYNIMECSALSLWLIGCLLTQHA